MARFIAITVVLVSLGGCAKEIWCNGSRLQQAQAVRQCMALERCKTTPEDLSLMLRIEERCAMEGG